MKISTSVNEHWKQLSKTALSKKEVRLYAKNLDWELVSRFAKLSKKTWLENQERIHHTLFPLNKNVPVEVYNALSREVKWGFLARHREVDNEFLEKVSVRFPTLTFFNQNELAKSISTETWEKVVKQNNKHIRLLHGDHKRAFIKQHLVSLGALRENATEWHKPEWKIISQYYPIDFDFAKEFAGYLHTRTLRSKNNVHKLTERELDELVEIVSHRVERNMSRGGTPEWSEICDKHIFSQWFINKYKIDSKFTK